MESDRQTKQIIHTGLIDRCVCLKQQQQQPVAADCGASGRGSHACEHVERSSSESLSKSSNSSPDSVPEDDDIKLNVNRLLRSERARAMQQYNAQRNTVMAYDDHQAARYSSFNGTVQESAFSSRSCSEVTTTQDSSAAAGRNMMLNFGGVVLDPSASFPGLGELPSTGMEPGVEQNLTGTFTGDLNSTAYEVVEDQDHSRLLQEMLQQHPGAARMPDAQVPAAASHGDWEDSLHVLQEMVHLQQQQQQHQIYSQQPQAFDPNWDRACNGTSAAKYPGGTGESDLLNLLQFPRPSFGYPGGRGKGPGGPDHCVLGYDPGLLNHHFQQQQQQQSSGRQRNYFQSYSRRDPAAEASGTRLPGSARSILLVDLEQERDDLSVKTFGGKGAPSGGKGEPRGVNHFATERQRREFLNEKYHTLRSLVPNPTKADRASIVADAIEYVKELKGTVQELQLMLQEKRRAAGDASSVKRRRSMDGGEDYTTIINNNTSTTMGSSGTPDNHKSNVDDHNGLRCSWLARTSQNGAHVDVRIVHDEVTIKVHQRRTKTCLLFFVLAVLQDLQLDLVHASGATIGDHDVFLFISKILEGSSVTFAGYITLKLLDALDRQLVI